MNKYLNCSINFVQFFHQYDFMIFWDFIVSQVPNSHECVGELTKNYPTLWSWTTISAKYRLSNGSGLTSLEKNTESFLYLHDFFIERFEPMCKHHIIENHNMDSSAHWLCCYPKKGIKVPSLLVFSTSELCSHRGTIGAR